MFFRENDYVKNIRPMNPLKFASMVVQAIVAEISIQCIGLFSVGVLSDAGIKTFSQGSIILGIILVLNKRSTMYFWVDKWNKNDHKPNIIVVNY